MAAVTTSLIAEIHGLSRDGAHLITVQHWSRGTLVVFRDGLLITRQRGPRAQIASLFEATAALATTQLNERDAMARLAELGGAMPGLCPRMDCAETLPIGGYRCRWCGATPARSAAGSMSAARRREPVLLHAGGAR